MLKRQKIRQIFHLKLKTALKRIEIFVYRDIHDGNENGNDNDDKDDDENGNGREEEDAAKDKEIH